MKSLRLYQQPSTTCSSPSFNNATNIKTSHKTQNIAKPYSSIEKMTPFILTNYKPIALPNTMYKLYISMFTTFLTNYGEKYKLLHFDREGFGHKENHKTNINNYHHPRRCPTYLPRHISHLHRLSQCLRFHRPRMTTAIMEDLGNPKNAVEIANNIYTYPTTTFHGSL